MTVRVNRRAVDNARRLVEVGEFVHDDRDAWSEHRPTSGRENEFLAGHGFGEYGKWYLGIDDERPEDTKGHYTFPYGDFERVHRCGLLSAESRAEQYRHHDIAAAVAHLHGMIDAKSP